MFNRRIQLIATQWASKHTRKRNMRTHLSHMRIHEIQQTHAHILLINIHKQRTHTHTHTHTQIMAVLRTAASRAQSTPDSWSLRTLCQLYMTDPAKDFVHAHAYTAQREWEQFLTTYLQKNAREKRTPNNQKSRENARTCPTAECCRTNVCAALIHGPQDTCVKARQNAGTVRNCDDKEVTANHQEHAGNFTRCKHADSNRARVSGHVSVEGHVCASVTHTSDDGHAYFDHCHEHSARACHEDNGTLNASMCTGFTACTVGLPKGTDLFGVGRGRNMTHKVIFP
jgi:hypothetical protein